MQPKNYDHAKEEELYALWEERQFFQPRPSDDPKQSRFCIIMPPPNANGDLHVGHALFVTIEDMLVRYHRMLGEETLWVPGADHAGIASQVVFERVLEKEGKTRFDLGRERFVDELYRFTLQHRTHMESQLRRLGASCDWARGAFTLEPRFERPIATTFLKLHEDGLLYRGERLINWCARCQTALSDLEVKHSEEPGLLWYIRYPAHQGKGAVTVATTRPETMLGDTAIAVHPNDKRWQKYIGTSVRIPLIDRVIPVIADEAVDMDFGTGAVKITPAHDAADFKIGVTHKLPSMPVIDFTGHMSKAAGPYQNLSVSKARKRVSEDLLVHHHLVKKVNYKHSVGHCARCGTVTEPRLSLQWFVKMDSLAARASKAVEKGDITITPKRYRKVFLSWLNNIEDWCISRQLWWGHQLPVWYCGSQGLSQLQKILNRLPETPGCGETIIAVTKPERCPKCGNTKLIRDPDTLDTWFSSGQWPFNVLGWEPNSTHQAPEFTRYYPTDLMETGYDIIFFWVARMVMLGLYVTNEVPFKHVFLHGIVRDAEGQKMSKSKGNVVDPLKLIDAYGADSMRFSLVSGTSPGRDSLIRLDYVKAGRNFANKLWNIGRFVEQTGALQESQTPSHRPEHIADLWILKQLSRTIHSVTKALDAPNPGRAIDTLYAFIWHDFADWYIEVAKTRPADDAMAKTVLRRVFETILALTHPVMPFVTEALWQIHRGAKGSQFLINERWPAPITLPRVATGAARQFEELRTLVNATRSLIKLAGVTDTKNLFVCYAAKTAPPEYYDTMLVKLCGATGITRIAQASKLPKGLKATGSLGTLVVASEESAMQKIRAKLTRRRAALSQQIDHKESLLKNKAFTAKAPASVVKEARQDLARLQHELSELTTTLTNII